MKKWNGGVAQVIEHLLLQVQDPIPLGMWGGCTFTGYIEM
jgi:hypothetical protein